MEKKKKKNRLQLGEVEEIQPDFWTLIFEINSSSDAYVLKTANSTYGEKTYPFHNKYLEDMKTYFGTKPRFFNFLEASDQIRKEIKSWLKSRTEGKIWTSYLTIAVDSATRMVLLNALYIKRIWGCQFSVQYTTEKPFRTRKTIRKLVQMMLMKEKLPIFHREKPQDIGLHSTARVINSACSYSCGKDISGLDQLEEAITYE